MVAYGLVPVLRDGPDMLPVLISEYSGGAGSPRRAC
jgi:hypothetical protein